MRTILDILYPASDPDSVVEKINLTEKKSPKIENFIFHFFESQSNPEQIWDTPRVFQSRTRDLVRIFGRIFPNTLCSRSAGRVT